jgi:hypothetical protein
VAGNDVPVLIDQNRDVEAEAKNAVRDLLDLFVGVRSRIQRIETEAVDREMPNGELVR